MGYQENISTAFTANITGACGIQVLGGLGYDANKNVVAFACGNQKKKKGLKKKFKKTKNNKSGFYFAYFLLSGGELIHVGQINKDPFVNVLHKSTLPALISCPIRIKSISCGSNHTMAISTNGKNKNFI
jgi:alpha-tubulin suppressor-like RCC1 family protein